MVWVVGTRELGTAAFQNADQNLRTTDDVTFNSITAQQYIVSSSVSHITTSFSSGSTVFGDDIADTHQFTGSLNISGSITTDTNVTIDSNGRVGINTTSPNYKLDVSGNVGVNEYIYHNGDTNTYLRYQTDQVDLSAGGQVTSLNTTGFTAPGHITASSNISASGDLSIRGFTSVSASLATIPTNNNQLTNGAGYLTTVDISDDTNLTAGNGITLTGDTLTVTAGTGLT